MEAHLTDIKPFNSRDLSTDTSIEMRRWNSSIKEKLFSVGYSVCFDLARNRQTNRMMKDFRRKVDMNKK